MISIQFLVSNKNEKSFTASAALREAFIACQNDWRLSLYTVDAKKLNARLFLPGLYFYTASHSESLSTLHFRRSTKNITAIEIFYILSWNLWYIFED